MEATAKSMIWLNAEMKSTSPAARTFGTFLWCALKTEQGEIASFQRGSSHGNANFKW